MLDEKAELLKLLASHRMQLLDAELDVLVASLESLAEVQQAYKEFRFVLWKYRIVQSKFTVRQLRLLYLDMIGYICPVCKQHRPEYSSWTFQPKIVQNKMLKANIAVKQTLLHNKITSMIPDTDTSSIVEEMFEKADRIIVQPHVTKGMLKEVYKQTRRDWPVDKQIRYFKKRVADLMESVQSNLQPKQCRACSKGNTQALSRVDRQRIRRQEKRNAERLTEDQR